MTSILHVIDSGGLYGAERVLLTLAEEQKRQGHKAIIATLREPGECERALEQAASGLDIETKTFSVNRGFSFAAAQAIWKYANERGVDVIHCHGYKPNILLGAIRQAGRVRLVTTIHGWTASNRFSKLWLYEWLDRRMLRRMDAVAVVSREMVDRFELARALGDRVHLVYNGLPEQINLTIELPDWIKQFCSREFTVAAVGRLSEEKGVDVLLRAIALLKERGKPVQALIVGEGPEKQRLIQQATESGLSELVLFCGYVDDAARILSLVDVYVLPSRSEGLPLVLLEAARAGLPIVSTAVGGVPELVEHGKSGLLCEVQDVAGMADRIENVRMNEERALRLGRTAQRLFSSKFTARVMTSAYFQLYRR